MNLNSKLLPKVDMLNLGFAKGKPLQHGNIIYLVPHDIFDRLPDSTISCACVMVSILDEAIKDGTD